MEPKAIFYYVFDGGQFKPDDPKRLVGTMNEDRKGAIEYQFYTGKPIEDWPEGVTFYVKGEHPQDFLLVRMSWIVVSDKVKKVFEDCHVEGVQFLPVRIIHEDTHKEYGPYWVWNVYQEVDGLDWEHTVWSRDNPQEIKYPELAILIPALRYDVLSGKDIFRLNIKGESATSVYISPRVKECMEKAGATTGFELDPIKAF